MRKLLTAGLILLALSAVTCTSTSNNGSAPVVFDTGLDYVPANPDREKDIPVQPMGDKTALEYFRDEHIAAGWNLGNSLDAHSSGFASEIAWGNPRINQELLNGVKNAGFDIIRIPVTWLGQIGKEPVYRIREAQLRRVGEVVDMAHEAGLKVIINIHHDGAGDMYTWLSINTARRSKEGLQQVTFEYVRIWTQIATYFRNYGDWLIFEAFNEIHDGSWGNNPGPMIADQLNILNDWTQLFTDVVRKTGGNNAFRYLVIPGYSANARQTLGVYFKLPNDSAPGRQIVTFHYYDPYQFGLEGSVSRWVSDSEKQKMEDDFRPFKERFIDQNVPVIIGECGAVLQLYPGNAEREETARQSRREYLAHVYGTAHKYGLVPIYWDNGGTTGSGEKYGLFNRRDGTPNSAESDLLIKAMINAVRD